uniref:Uncharacterized protein n=1 Tax=Chenopodium quinoa TaxID=63459 RepID=A0A803N806_CHEQI
MENIEDSCMQINFDMQIDPDTNSGSTIVDISQASFTSYSSSHQAFIAEVGSLKEPSSYKEAVGDQNWELAMSKGLEALKKNNTWILVDLPPEKKQ